MAYLSIYRRYRPDSFDWVIGQEHIVRILTNQVKNDKISHAYLFTGARGTGKTSVAKIFARAINCPNNSTGSSCGICDVCKELNLANNLDIIEMDAASNNGVDDIRDIREAIKYAPTTGKYKVYIIDEAHMLTAGAFNALLKTLEEPPPHAVFILATTEAHKIPDTILSRCMRFDFRLVSSQLIAERIKYIYNDMKVTYEDSAVMAIAEAGDGSVRDSLSIADMCVSYGEGNVTYNDTLEVLGASSPSKIVDMIQAMLSGNISDAFKVIDELSSLGKSVQALVKDITKMLRNLYVAKTCEGAGELLSLPKEIELRLYKLANYESVRLINIIDIFSGLESSMRYSRLPRIVLESAVAKSAEITSNIDINGLLSRIKALENGAVIRPQGAVAAATENTTETPAKKSSFNALEACGHLKKYLQAEGKLIGMQLLLGINTENMRQEKEKIIIGVDNDRVKQAFLKENCDKLFKEILVKVYDITSVEFQILKNNKEISQDIEYVKNLIGANIVNIIK